MGFRFSFLYLLFLAGPGGKGRSVRGPAHPGALTNLQGDFLKVLNLSGVPQEPRRVQLPSFMMDLYNTYAAETPSVPRSDVIRSFAVRDLTCSVSRDLLTDLRLLFLVSVPDHEMVTKVQLQLFLPSDHRPACQNVSVSVSDVVRVRGAETIHLLDKKEVGGARNGWETLDVTAGVRKWRGAGELRLQVDGHGCVRNISLNTEENTGPILMVFSDDLEKKKKEKSTADHQDENVFWNEVPPDRNDTPLRRRRSPQTNFCHRTSMKVNFKDIGWDKWIVAPPEYEAYECRGACLFPLTEKVTPSKHAIIQTLVNLKNPKKVNNACCVPTKLDPLTVMYQENGVITVRHLYEEMKVARCGCR